MAQLFNNNIAFVSSNGAHRKSPLGRDLGIDQFAKKHGFKSNVTEDVFRDAADVTENAEKMGDGMRFQNGLIAGLLNQNKNNGLLNIGASLISYLTQSNLEPLGKNQAIYYTTETHVGQPTTYKIQKLNEDAFVEKNTKILADTQYDYQTHLQREKLKIMHGFNQKSFTFLMEDTFMTLKDLYQLFRIKERFKQELKVIKDGTTDIYGCLLSSLTQLKIKNKLDNYSVHINIHLIRIFDHEMDTRDLIENMTSNKTVKTQDPTGRIPLDFQYSDPETRHMSDKCKISFNTDLRCSLTQSSIFNENASILRTWSMTLPPSSIWDFKITTHYGKGIHINTVNDLHNRSYSSESSQNENEVVDQTTPLERILQAINDTKDQTNLRAGKQNIEILTDKIVQALAMHLKQNNNQQTKDSHPISYSLCLECVGDRRASILKTSTKDSFDGYSPSCLHLEFSKTITYLSDQENEDDLLVYKIKQQERNFSEESQFGPIFCPNRKTKFNVNYEDISFPGKTKRSADYKYQMEYDNLVMTNPDTPEFMDRITKGLSALGLFNPTQNDKDFNFKSTNTTDLDSDEYEQTVPPRPESEQL